MTAPYPFTALAIGDGNRAEFRDVLASLSTRLPTESAATIDAALDGTAAPDLVVFFESRPGEFTQHDVERLRSCWPLAGMIVVLGSWCEAESRSGRPLVGTWRVFWHQWSPRFEIELARWQSGRCPAWGLPATTMEEERIQRIESPRAGKNGCPTGLIAIRTKQRELAGLLADVCRTAGRSSIWWVEDRLPDGDIEAVLYDLALPTTQAELAANFRPWLPRPIIALADYPRAEDVAAALAAGAASLLSKPLVVEDLIRQFDNA